MKTTSTQFPLAKDPLGSFLHQLRLDGSLYCRSQLSGDWSLAMPVLPGKMMIHIITAGQCWLTIDGEQPIQLKQGALALIPHGNGHTICSNPELESTPLFEAGVERISERYEMLEIAGDGPTTELTCGVTSFDQFSGQQLIQQLPTLVLLDQLEKSEQRWLDNTLEFIASEAKQLKPGGETIITHLADILVIQLIRHWMEQSSQAHKGWLGALRDKHIGVALQAIHNQPDIKWSVDSLAKTCGMSRSGFSAHFKQLVGSSVKSYLTQWRMNIALQRLRQSNEPLITLAQELGYNSEAAFSRAFKRVMGVSPGKVYARETA